MSNDQVAAPVGEPIASWECGTPATKGCGRQLYDPDHTATVVQCGVDAGAGVRHYCATCAAWQPMETATRQGEQVHGWVMGQLRDGTTVRMHWASDLSGEEQPAFRGWFKADGPHRHVQVDPVRWRPFTPEEAVVCAACGGQLQATASPVYTRQCVACKRYYMRSEVARG